MFEKTREDVSENTTSLKKKKKNRMENTISHFETTPLRDKTQYFTKHKNFNKTKWHFTKHHILQDVTFFQNTTRQEEAL